MFVVMNIYNGKYIQLKVQADQNSYVNNFSHM